MRFAGSWLQRCGHIFEYILRAFNDLLNRLTHFIGESTNECSQDFLENHRHRVTTKIGIRQEVEMPLEPCCQRASSSSRGSHGCNEHNVLDLHERLLFLSSIIPALVVHPLSKDLNWRLCTISFFLWHIEIVNEDGESFSSWWTVHALSSFLELFIETFLCLIG